MDKYQRNELWAGLGLAVEPLGPRPLFRCKPRQSMVTHGRQPNPIDCQTAFGERVLALLALGSEARLVRLNQLLADLLPLLRADA